MLAFLKRQNAERLLRSTPSLLPTSTSTLLPTSTSTSSFSSASSSIVGSFTTPVTKKLWQERLARQGPKSLEGTLPSQVLAKNSEVQMVHYPLSTDHELRENYRSPWGYVRMGKLLEDLDSLAGNLAFAHCDDGLPETRPPLLVTATVERIRLTRQMPIDGGDLTLSGRVIWTGSSSMDIQIQCHQGAITPNLSAIFTFVARDPLTHKSTKINPVLPDSNEEHKLFEEREGINQMRKALRTSPNAGLGLEGVGPGTATPAAVNKWIDQVLTESQILSELPSLASSNVVRMADTKATNLFCTQPQHRNLSNRIFGGFLMRRAFELGFAAAYSFAGVRPQFVQMDDVTFAKPVEIGSLLKFTSTVVHAGSNLVHVEVVASITKPEEVSTTISNRFAFEFRVPDGHPLKRVLPGNHEEAKRAARFNLNSILKAAVA